MSTFEELTNLFINNPIEAIQASQNIICSVTGFESYKEFYSYHLEHPHMSTCQREWSKPQMSIHCVDCAKNPQSCICLQCFLNGNHEGHEYIIRANSTGNCDCGDFTLWKSSGFCKDHHGLESDSRPENYLDEKLRVALTDIIFKAAFASFKDLQTNDDQKISQIISFISSFLKFGDGFRRLIAISLTEKTDIKSIFSNVFQSSSEFNLLFEQLCGGLVNDDVFRYNIAPIVFQLMIEKIIPLDFENAIQDKKPTNYKIWDSFWFHAFSTSPIQHCIIEHKIDWVSFILQFETLLKEFFSLVGRVSLNFTTSSYYHEISINVPRAYKCQTIEEIQHLFDDLFTKIFSCGSKEGMSEGKNDTILVTSFSDTYQENQYISVYLFKMIYLDILNIFQCKKDLKLAKLIEELDKSFDISPIFCLNKNKIGDNNENENDKLISRFLKKVDESSIIFPDQYYKSFHNGASFFFSHPTLESLMYIFNYDNMNRVKIARFLSMGKYQNLRIQLGIATLKGILSYTCFHQSLTRQNNHSLALFLSIMTKPNNICYSVPYFIPILQLILGLKCNEANVVNEFSIKEFFAFEMAREIGLFDNFQNDDYSNEEIVPLQEQMIFSVLYLAILFVIERTLFNYSGFNFIKEQIILALKGGVSHLDELNKSFDSDTDNHFKQDFNKIISNVTTTNRRSDEEENDEINETSFYLKKEIEWKTISALNLLNSQKVILDKEVTKNPNNLIRIPEFEPEETYFFHSPNSPNGKSIRDDFNEYDIDSTGLDIRLKELLFTPTILAIVYHSLRGNHDDVKRKAGLNNHLAMMILVLISRFVKDIDEKSQPASSFNESTVIQYDSTIADLISKLKTTVFNYVVDSNGNATVENTLNSKSFDLFLKMKIGTENCAPKSFIDILLEKGELGKNVLVQMSIDISNYGFKDPNSELDQALLKKKRANKMKEDILNQYKNAISNYNIGELDKIDESPAPSSTVGDVCSICSTLQKNEILSYTLYMYRTKLPFVFDKPPLIKYNPQFEIPIDDDINDFLMKNDDKFEEEEEEEEAPDLEGMLEAFQDRGNEDDQLNYYMVQMIIQHYRQKLNSFENHKVMREISRKRKVYNDDLINSEGYKTGVSNIERRITAGNNFIIQFNTCQHPVHFDCVKKDDFACPIDRSVRNGFLPAIDGIPITKIFKDFKTNSDVNNPDSFTDEFKESISHFVDRYTTFFDSSNKVTIDIFIELIKSISGLISTYEIRLRSLPDCLDSLKTKILSRNLFLTVWYAYRICGKPKMKLNNLEDVDVESRLTTFQQFIKRLLESDKIITTDYSKQADTEKTFMEIVSSFVNSPNFWTSDDPVRKDKEIFLFLRRACLSDYYLLDNNVSNEGEYSNLIDWDEIISVSNLSEHYKVELSSLKQIEKDGDGFEFKPFTFAKLPKEFLRFGFKPYEFHVDYTQQFVLFNMIDYNYLIKHFDDFDDKTYNEEEELAHNQRNTIVFQRGLSGLGIIISARYSRYIYPSLFLLIGKDASEGIMVDQNHIGPMKPFYLDRFGCEDIGYKRNMPLFLNEERYERLIDKVLSGEFASVFGD